MYGENMKFTHFNIILRLRLGHPSEINYEYLVNRELGSLLGIVTRLWAG